MFYIALLRGLNVGGHTIKMERLRQLFVEMGFTNVRSYIQSGNIFFESERTDQAALTQSIELHLGQALGYEVPVFLRTLPEFERLLTLDPFKHLTVTPEMRLCILFTQEQIPTTLALPLFSPKKDMEIIQVTEREAFVIWHLKNGRPPAALGFKALSGKTTTRFFHTAAKILLAAKAAQ